MKSPFQTLSFVVIVLVVAALFAGAACAEEPRPHQDGKITSTVRDQEGKALQVTGVATFGLG